MLSIVNNKLGFLRNSISGTYISKVIKLAKHTLKKEISCRFQLYFLKIETH